MFETEDGVFQAMLKTYGRNEETLRADVLTLQEWMKTQHHLPEVLDEKRLQNFLLLNKCSIEKAKQKIDNYYTIRQHIPEIYDNCNPRSPQLKNAMNAVYFVPLPKLTKEMYRVIWHKVRDKDLMDDINPHLIAAYEVSTFEVRMAEDHIFGDVVVWDMKDISWTHMLKLTPSVLVKNLKPYEKVFSFPMKAFYVINMLPTAYSLLNIVKGLMKAKLFERIHLYPDSSVIFEKFPLEAIPKDYGGTEKSLEELQAELKKKFENHEARFDSLDEMRVNEKERPEKLKNDEILGFHGNFKQLNVD